MKLGLIGGGVMAEAIIRSITGQGVYAPGEITVSDISPQRCTHLANSFRVTCINDNREVVKGSDLVLLAIKPQVFNDVMSEIKGLFNQKQLLISIMAGINLESIKRASGHNVIVRVMPNTPAQIGEGVSVWTATREVNEKLLEQARAILATLGKEIHVKDEKYLDMATAVSGSGPAYVFLFIESLIDAAVHIGFSRDVATEMTLQTVSGSTSLLKKTGAHPAVARNAVTSPGGTTAEGLMQLEEGKIRATVTKAVIAAYNKARALSQ